MRRVGAGGAGMSTSAIGAPLLPETPRVHVQEKARKICPRCGLPKDAGDFYPKVWTDRRKTPPVLRHGLSPYCKECTTAVSMARQARPEVAARKRDRQRESRAARTDDARERARVYMAQWRRVHQEELRAYYQRRKAAGLVPPQRKETRRCLGCKDDKPRDAFPDERGRFCAECRPIHMAQRADARRARRRASYQEHRTEVLSATRARYVARQEARGRPTPARRPRGYWTCRVCKEQRPRADFGGQRGRPCLACLAQRPPRAQGFASEADRQRAYYQAHREEKIAYQRAYNAAHQEERQAYERARYQAHREERLAYQRAYRARRKAAATEDAHAEVTE